MKASILKKPFEIAIEEVPTPVPRPDELLIQVKASAICGSDIKAYEGKHPLIRPPIILGHEFSGVIVEKGSQVNGFRVGERVVVEPSFVCGQCFFCQRMDYYLCERLEQLGHQLPGSFAEYTVAKARFAYLLPNGIPFEKAALTQPLAFRSSMMMRWWMTSSPHPLPSLPGAAQPMPISLEGVEVAIRRAVDRMTRLDVIEKVEGAISLRCHS